MFVYDNRGVAHALKREGATRKRGTCPSRTHATFMNIVSNVKFMLRPSWKREQA